MSRGLDRAVAVKVMGLRRLALKKTPKYSTDIKEAMKVVDQMRQKGHRWLLVASAQGFFLRHLASVTHDLERDEKMYTADRPIGMVATTVDELPKVICEAALEEIGK